jgi:hypothetical protein
VEVDAILSPRLPAIHQRELAPVKWMEWMGNPEPLGRIDWIRCS